MATTLVAGSVTINQTTGAETYVPGLAVYLYEQRLAAAKIPDPDHPKGCTVTATAGSGATNISVNTSAGYRVGDVLVEYTYMNPVPVGGQYVSASTTLTISAIPDGTHITVSPAIPGGPGLVLGLQIGFKGTLSEWQAQVQKQFVKAKTNIADAVNADATAIVNFLGLALIGEVIKSMGDTNQVLTAEEARRPFVRTTGALTATRVLSGFYLPANSDEYYTRTIINDCTGGSITVASSSGTTVTIAAAGRQIVGFSPSGVETIL